MRTILSVTFALLASSGAASQLSAQTGLDWAAAEQAILRLPPSRFPQLPRAVREELDQRRCTIPQTYFPGPPHNVIEGAFARPGQRDWAVVCSLNRRSTILVFWAGKLTPPPAELAPMDDSHFLQTIGDGKIGYSRAIDRVNPAWIRVYAQEYGGPLPKRLDHDGINDAFLEKASQVLYQEDGGWQELAGYD
jgi:hypothetical protein